MNIHHHLGLTNPTKAIVVQNCKVALIKDNHKLYCLENLLSFLTRDFIGVDKQDILLIKNLKLHKVTHITI
jgi:hypothetical protein